jgi:hypothetical protein
MTFVSELKTSVNEILQYGERVRLRYFTQSYGAGSYYDDDVSYVQSGTDIYTSGLICPIDTKLGGYDALLLQQGKILYDDKKVYVIGDIQTSGLSPIKLGMNGSPPTQEYQIISDGQVTAWTLNQLPVYKKIYVRFLSTGSFIGE